MDILDLFLLLPFAALVVFWFDSLRALEVARNAGKQACMREGVQFLDDTVTVSALALGRDAQGRIAIRRTYRFEFSDTGDNRLEGTLVLLGARVESMDMEPFRFLP
ncbi:MAG TPA: DUF3301 domain-containing protein [Sulfuricella sp.]|nr:DUF3301 domain-containing protein [Sulfuricella sp.]